MDLRASKPTLILVTDRTLCGARSMEAIKSAVEGGVDCVQVRDRTLSGNDFLDHFEAIRCAAKIGAKRRDGEVELIVNRYLDVALVASADGIHLGFDAVSPSVARDLLGTKIKVSIACHSARELAARADPLISMAYLAPVFSPLSKTSTRAPLTISAIQEASQIGIPVIAQGGVDPRTAGDCIQAGAAGVAVTGYMLQSDDPCEAAKRLRNELDRHS